MVLIIIHPEMFAFQNYYEEENKLRKYFIRKAFQRRYEKHY